MIIETYQTIRLYATLREMRIESKRLGGSSTQLERLVVELIFCEFSLCLVESESLTKETSFKQGHSDQSFIK